MFKKNSNWYIPSDVKCIWSILLVIPIIAILTALLLPAAVKLKTADIEYRVYSDVLSELKCFSKEKNVLVIRNKTTCSNFLDYDTEAKSRVKNNFGSALDDSLFEEFGGINAEPILLEERFKDSLNVVLLSKEEHDSIFTPVDSGWNRFYTKYSKTLGIVELSRVAFDSTKTKALLYWGFIFDRGKGGIGYYILLKKLNGKWVIEKKVMAWIA